MQKDNITKWGESKSSSIEDLIKAKGEALKNCGIYICAPYVTGIINYKEVKQILKECECGYTKRHDSHNNLIIDNIIDKNNKLKDYNILYHILQLHGAILFIG